MNLTLASKYRKSSFRRNREGVEDKTVRLGCTRKNKEIRRRKMQLVKKLAMIACKGLRKEWSVAGSKTARPWLNMLQVKSYLLVDNKSHRCRVAQCKFTFRIKKLCKIRTHFSLVAKTVRPKDCLNQSLLSARAPSKEVQTSSNIPSFSKLRK